MTPNESPAALLPMLDEIGERFTPGRNSMTADGAITIAKEEWDRLRAAIASTAHAASESRWSVPDGFVLVPREPTAQMLAACERQWVVGSALDMARREWNAMLAAAPTPPAVASGEPTAEQDALIRELRDALLGKMPPMPHGTVVDVLSVSTEIKHAAIAKADAYLARSAAAKGEG